MLTARLSSAMAAVLKPSACRRAIPASGQSAGLSPSVAHGTWNSDGTKVTASFEQSAISTESNAITWDTARFLGSLHKNGATTIVYDGVTYVWDKDGGLQGSNWYDSSDKGLTTGDNANTLVKALADAGVFDGDETATAYSDCGRRGHHYHF